MTMRLIRSGALSAPVQMALDDAIARSVRAGKAPPTLRLYTWERPAFTIGSLQRLEETFDLEACRQAGIPIIRRLTGGRAVYHDREVTYAVAARADHPVFRGSVRATFQTIARGLVAGLKLLGIEGVLTEPCRDAGVRRMPPSVLCALVETGYDLKVLGKKLIGSAQRRWPDGFLQQGSLPLTLSPRGFLPCLRPALSLHEVMAACSSLAEILRRDVTPDEVMAAICHGMEAALGVRLIEAAATAEEDETAEALARDRYAPLL